MTQGLSRQKKSPVTPSIFPFTETTTFTFSRCHLVLATLYLTMYVVGSSSGGGEGVVLDIIYWLPNIKNCRFRSLSFFGPTKLMGPFIFHPLKLCKDCPPFLSFTSCLIFWETDRLSKLLPHIKAHRHCMKVHISPLVWPSCGWWLQPWN